MSKYIIQPDAAIAQQAARILLDTKAVNVRPSDPFTFTSGRKSPVYVDCRRLISFPKERNILMEMAENMLNARIGGDNIDAFAGGETAGIPYAAFLAERQNKPMVYVRKKPKGFGKMSQIEGFFENDTPKVALIEDLQSEGTSKRVFVDALREAGAQVDHAFVIFHYGIFPSSPASMEEMKVSLHFLADWDAIVKVIEDEKRLSDAELASLKSFLNAPDAWAA